MCPEGKLTPEISRRYDMPVIFITIDDRQEHLSSMPGPIKEQTVENLARLALRAPSLHSANNSAPDQHLRTSRHGHHASA